MNKAFLPFIAAACFSIGFQGLAFSADEAPADASPQQSQEPAVSSPAQQAEQADPGMDNSEFFAEMDKCEALQGVAEKQQCVDTVRKQFGQM